VNSLILLANAGVPTQSLSIFDPASPPAASIRNLSVLVLVITGLIFIVVESILIYVLVRFRRAAASTTTPVPEGTPPSPHPLPPWGGEGGVRGAEAEPPQVYGSKPIEIAWTAAPALIVFILVLVTTRTLWEVDVTPPEPRPGDQTLFVTVVGHQWWWEYRYDHYDGKELGFVTANELHIPASTAANKRPIFLKLKSADVCHSFWVPRLAGKTDLLPGRTNHMWFQTDETGLFQGQCAEFCGTQHANMLIRVVAEPAEEFDRWLVNEKKPAMDDPQLYKAKEKFLSLSCINCHRVGGTKLAEGTYAPDLTHLMSRKTLASGMIPNERDTLRRWIVEPQTIKPGCLMPAFNLSKGDLDLVVDYLASLR
jgi:cytochrome c oxidase subunit II